MIEKKRSQPIAATSLQYRPRDYFGRFDLQTELLTQVKGLARREAIKEALDKGEIDKIPDYVRAAELSSAERQRIGRIHPMFMGGEYLPGLKSGEVEIARISIQSTTCDVTVVYARPVGKRIRYRVADEYQGDTLSGRWERTSVKPLTMEQLVDFFLRAWDLKSVLEYNFGSDLEGMLGFFSGESEFYPYFDTELRRRVEEWFGSPVGDVEEDDA